MEYLKVRNKFISVPLWDIVNDIKNTVTNGKLRTIKLQGDKNIRVTCPHHNEGKELNPDCDIYIGPTVYDKKGRIAVVYGTVKCFACGFKGDFTSFVAECFDESYSWAQSWLLKKYTDNVLDTPPFTPVPLLSDIKKPSIPEFLPENILDGLESFHPYLIQRKLTKEVIKKFELRYDPKSKCIVFPVRDEKGRLVMLTRRSVETKQFIIDKDKQKPIYLLYYLLQNNIKEAFVYESQFNALTMWTHNKAGIALFGTGTQYQYELLNRSGIMKYTLLFDGDEAGDKGIEKFLANIRKDVMIEIIRLPRGKDVNDLSYDELEALLKKST